LFPSDGSVTYKLYGQFLQTLVPDNRIPSDHRSAGARLEYGSLEGWSLGSSYFASTRSGRWNHVGGFDGLWQGDGWELMGEFLAGRADPRGKHVVGFYVQGVHELIHTLFAVGRYELFDAGDPRPVVNLFDLGLSWRPSPY